MRGRRGPFLLTAAGARRHQHQSIDHHRSRQIKTNEDGRRARVDDDDVASKHANYIIILKVLQTSALLGLEADDFLRLYQLLPF